MLWDYKAYDADLTIHAGREEAIDFVNLAVQLRNRGLQVYEAQIVRQDSRLERMRQRVEEGEKITFHAPRKTTWVRSIITALYFWRRP